MRVLIVEDTILKYIEIKREISRCGEFQFTHESLLTTAKATLKTNKDNNTMFDLLITDMQYPNQPGETELLDAGFQLIDYIQSLDIQIPIIICSTRKFSVNNMNNILGSVRYSKNVDLEYEFKKLLTKLK